MNFSRNSFGPVLEHGGTRFQLWAPAAHNVAVLIEGRAPIALQRAGGGFWQIWCDTGPGTLYRFNVDGKTVTDPASRSQPSDAGGPSRVVDPAAYVWQTRDWNGLPWERTVLYEVHAGIEGGFSGVRSRLADLVDLGVTAIELMPIADFSGTRNWGYDGVLPFAPDSAYGNPDELRALIDEAHARGLMIILDVVYNHFGPQDNYLPSYAPEFFNKATQTPWGAAIDFHKPEVRRFFTENALYWLEEYRFDGLRLDAVHAISDGSWLPEMAAAVRAQCGARHIHLVAENEANEARLLESGIDAQWNDDFHNAMHVILTGETHAYYRDFAERPAEKLARCLAEGFAYQGQPSLYHDNRPRGQPSAHLPVTAFVNFLQNHDQVGNRAFGERLTQFTRPDALRAAMALLLLCPQIPLLFMGEEFGAREPFLFFTDFAGQLAEKVRAGRRREFAATPGFDGVSNLQTIPDPNAESSFTASRYTRKAADAQQWRALVRDLLALRRLHITPFLKSTHAIGTEVIGNCTVQARWRLGEAGTLIIFTNLDLVPVAAPVPRSAPLFGAEPADNCIPGDSTLAWIVP
jgi:maltooligosyltrehalose trehalohydrolase